MEPSYQTRKLIGRILLWVLLGSVAGAFWAQYTSPVVQTLAARAEKPLELVVFTQPAMRFVYHPVTRKAVVTLAHKNCSLQNRSACFNGEVAYFFQPRQTEQHTYWEQFKEGLSSWRFNPGRLFGYLRAYINALVQKRTNLRPSEFILLSLELPYLTASDFAIEEPVKKKNTRAEKAAKTAVAATPHKTPADGLLKVVILNASGKKGQAETLKKYLREQQAKGLLAVDVYETGNYPTQEDQSFILDYSGNQVLATQISRAIGITGEIRSAPATPDIYYDARIVLGKDFEMPL